MFRTDRGTVVAACLMSALGCLMACALLGFPATGGVRFAWVLLWATASVAGMRFLRVQDRRAKACFGTFGALFVLALIALLLLLPLCRWPLLTMLTLYGALDLFFAAKSALEAPRGKLLTFICLPFLFPVVHIVYGAGTLCGLLAGKAQPHA